MISGGVVPGGSWRSCVWQMAVTCATALPMLHLRLEEDLDDPDAVERLRLDVLDVVDRGGQRALADA